MQTIIGWILLTLGGILYFIQLLSSVNFKLAQKLGFQEDPEQTDTLLQRAERYTAYWDVVTLIWLPIAGVFMLINHAWWPIISLIAGSIYIDASGREAVKNISFLHEGIRVGRSDQQKVFFLSYIMMGILGIGLIFYSLNTLMA